MKALIDDNLTTENDQFSLNADVRPMCRC